MQKSTPTTEARSGDRLTKFEIKKLIAAILIGHLDAMDQKHGDRTKPEPAK